MFEHREELVAILLRHIEDWIDREWAQRIMKEHGYLGEFTAADKEYLRRILDLSEAAAGDLEDNMTKHSFYAVNEGITSGMSEDNIIANVRAALDAVLGGKTGPPDQKASMGCNIKWKPGNEPEWF